MFRSGYNLLIRVLILTTFLFCSCSGIPGRINSWHIESGQPGNEFYQPITKEMFETDMKAHLEQYRERFNFDRQIAWLRKKPKNPLKGFRFVVMGDTRSNPELWNNIVKHVNQLAPKPDFVINTGDVVLNGFASEFHDYYIPPLLKTDIPFFIVIGNHEEGYKDLVMEFRYLFGDNALNYFFDYGNIRFIFFDNVTKLITAQPSLQWLENTLAKTPEDFRIIVAAYRPPGNIEKWAYHAMPKADSEAFTDLMGRYKADHVFLGHIHAYSTARFNHVDYTVTGGGGAILYPHYGSLGTVHHYIICDVLPDGVVQFGHDLFPFLHFIGPCPGRCNRV